MGPAIAVIWGWLPAFLWVVFGTVLFAGMHDLGSLWASVRNKGQSLGSLSGRYIGPRGRNLFLVVIFFLLMMVIAAFATDHRRCLLVASPIAVIPTWGALIVAVFVGQAMYRYNWNLPIVTVVGVAALCVLVPLGDRFPLAIPEVCTWAAGNYLVDYHSVRLWCGRIAAAGLGADAAARLHQRSAAVYRSWACSTRPLLSQHQRLLRQPSTIVSRLIPHR